MLVCVSYTYVNSCTIVVIRLHVSGCHPVSIASADAYLTPCIKDYINSFASGFLHKVGRYASVS